MIIGNVLEDALLAVLITYKVVYKVYSLSTHIQQFSIHLTSFVCNFLNNNSDTRLAYRPVHTP